MQTHGRQRYPRGTLDDGLKAAVGLLDAELDELYVRVTLRVERDGATVLCDSDDLLLDGVETIRQIG